MRRLVILFLSLYSSLFACAQVGEHRSTFSVGVNGGYVLSSVGFDPKVSQSYHGGAVAGLSWRYTCEKYFKTICSIYGEISYASLGWKQDIVTSSGAPVVNANGQQESYSRTINYVQAPILAHLAWGREESGGNFFVELGPQFGLYLSESTSKSYDSPNLSTDETGRSNTIVPQESMPVEKKLDYGITAGIGFEWSQQKVGHFLLTARYYYGLGNIYGSTKKDYFGKSNLSNISVKLTYLFDLVKNNN